MTKKCADTFSSGSVDVLVVVVFGFVSFLVSMGMTNRERFLVRLFGCVGVGVAVGVVFDFYESRTRVCRLPDDKMENG